MSELEDIRENALKEEEAKFLPLPDLIFVDGGEKHRNAALGVLEELKIDVPVFGIVKDDNHRTRGLVSEKGEICLDKKSEAFMLLVNIQDEMHRRAITYLRNSEKKKSTQSELDLISGVGEKRRKTLLSHFKSIKKIRQASLEELKNVKGIDSATAQKIYEYYNNEKDTVMEE